jgi:hypothetical protein
MSRALPLFIAATFLVATLLLASLVSLATARAAIHAAGPDAAPAPDRAATSLVLAAEDDPAEATPARFDLGSYPHAISPDGRLIAAIVTVRHCERAVAREEAHFVCPGAAIYLVSPSGDLLDCLVEPDGDLALGALAWAADGASLTFEAAEIGDDALVIRSETRAIELPDRFARGGGGER